MMRYEIRLAGTGGQGQILAGIILAEAAAIHDGLNAVQTQSYGPESRGGASKAEVIISDGMIDYPKVNIPHLLLAMSQEAYDKYLDDIQPGGLIIVDSTLVKRLKQVNSDATVVNLPITGIARDEIGREIVANIVALGAIAALSDIVSRDSVERAVLKRVPRGTEDLNRRAFEAGFRAASETVRAAG